jgi:hypothetical protein
MEELRAMRLLAESGDSFLVHHSHQLALKISAELSEVSLETLVWHLIQDVTPKRDVDGRRTRMRLGMMCHRARGEHLHTASIAAVGKRKLLLSREEGRVSCDRPLMSIVQELKVNRGLGVPRFAAIVAEAAGVHWVCWTPGDALERL